MFYEVLYEDQCLIGYFACFYFIDGSKLNDLWFGFVVGIGNLSYEL